MPIGTSTGKTYDDQFEQVADMHNLLPSDPSATPKAGQTVEKPVISASGENQKFVDFMIPDYLKPDTNTEALKAFPLTDKIPEINKDPTGQMVKTALDAATSAMPLGAGAKLAVAGSPMAKGAFEALEAEMKTLFKDTATKVDVKAEWDAFNKKYDATQAAKTAEETTGIFSAAKTYIASMKAKVDAFDQKLTAKIGEGLKNKYAEHLEPVDWQSVKSPLYPDLGKGAADDELTTRAKGAGFNVNFPLFKGGHSSPEKFESVPDPTKKNVERGIFYTDDPHVADSYAADKNYVGTYVARAPKALQVDWLKATGYKNYDPDHMHPLIEAAHEQKADMLIVKNLKDVGGHQNQYVILNPSVVRRPDAAFDTSKLHLNHLLASTGAFGVVAHEGLKEDK